MSNLTLKVTEQFLLPRSPKPAAKLASWVIDNNLEVVEVLRSLVIEGSSHMSNEQVTISLLENTPFKAELCLELLRYNEDAVVKRWDKVSAQYPEMVAEFFPRGFEDFLEAAKCDYLDPDVQKSHTANTVLRLSKIVETETIKDPKAPPPIKEWVFETRPELGDPTHLPRVTRRLQKKAITAEMLKASQTMTNVPFAWNKYSQAILDAFKDSPLAQEKKWSQWLKQAAGEINAVQSWKQFFIVWSRWEWRMRAMCTTKDRFNLQGNKLARALFRLAIPVEIEDEAWPSLYYSLGKRGVTEDNYLSIIEQGISCKGDIETFAAAQDLLEMKETGKSSALWGLDQVASLMRLIAAYFGDVRAYRDVGMDRIGLPWEGTPMVDVWHLICKDILLRDEDVSQYYDMDAATMKMARTIAKLIGTRHGFGAGPQTAAYGLLGLDRERDESRIDTYEGLDQILDKIEWPELYRHLADDDWTPDEHMALAKSKAELVIESIDSHYSWLSEDMGFIKNLMRNRVYHGKDLRDKPYPLPKIVGPYGFEMDPQCWRRSKHKVDRIKTSLNGQSIEGTMYRTSYDPLPDLGTMFIHFVESIETLKTNLTFTDEVSKNFVSIFDNYLTDANGLRHLPEHHTRAFIGTMEHFEKAGYPLEVWANSMDVPFLTRTITSRDINPMSCFLDA